MNYDKEQTPSAGATRAAKRIGAYVPGRTTSFLELVADIIDEETHATEMLAFIEEVAEGNFGGVGSFTLNTMQDEAFALIKKVRG